MSAWLAVWINHQNILEIRQTCSDATCRRLDLSEDGNQSADANGQSRAVDIVQIVNIIDRPVRDQNVL